MLSRNSRPRRRWESRITKGDLVKHFLESASNNNSNSSNKLADFEISISHVLEKNCPPRTSSPITTISNKSPSQRSRNNLTILSKDTKSGSRLTCQDQHSRTTLFLGNNINRKGLRFNHSNNSISNTRLKFRNLLQQPNPNNNKSSGQYSLKSGLSPNSQQHSRNKMDQLETDRVKGRSQL